MKRKGGERERERKIGPIPTFTQLLFELIKGAKNRVERVGKQCEKN